MDLAIKILQIASILLGGGLLVSMWGFLLKIWKRIKANELGTQALLRDRLYDIYFKADADGYRTKDMSDNFENLWKQYEALGQNGVMKQTHTDFLDLPMTQSEVHHHNKKQFVEDDA